MIKEEINSRDVNCSSEESGRTVLVLCIKTDLLFYNFSILLFRSPRVTVSFLFAIFQINIGLNSGITNYVHNLDVGVEVRNNFTIVSRTKFSPLVIKWGNK